jgi:ADP-ribosylglycohydrolase/protein-tyrosine phosphatase
VLNGYRLPGLPVLCHEYPAVHGNHAGTRAKLADLASADVTTIVNLTDVADRLEPYNVSAAGLVTARGPWAPVVTSCPIPDAGTPADVAAFATLVERCVAAMQWSSGTLAIHCWGGIGRTGMVAAALLVRDGWPVELALEEVNARWHATPKGQTPRGQLMRAPETERQWAMVRAYAQHLATTQPPMPRMAWAPDSGRIPVAVSRACLLGGAIGDALGAPVEFLRWAEIRERYGASGIRAFDTAYGVVGAITDDTQMSLFTAEALIHARAASEGADAVAPHARRAYARWYRTQRHTSAPDDASALLLDDPRLFATRAPGTTCLSAFAAGVVLDADLYPRNDSKGCGTVMRVAPAGLCYAGADAFVAGALVSRVTHGHPVGWLAGGACAMLISAMARGAPLRVAVAATITHLEGMAEHRDAARLVAQHLDAGFDTGTRVGDALTPEVIESLGGGWVAEEALAIAVACAAAHPQNFEAAVCAAVNHSGDSDSTGAIAGHLSGLLVGLGGIPASWRREVECADLVTAVADDLVFGGPDDAGWRARWIG